MVKNTKIVKSAKNLIFFSLGVAKTAPSPSKIDVQKKIKKKFFFYFFFGHPSPSPAGSPRGHDGTWPLPNLESVITFSNWELLRSNWMPPGGSWGQGTQRSRSGATKSPGHRQTCLGQTDGRTDGQVNREWLTWVRHRWTEWAGFPPPCYLAKSVESPSAKCQERGARRSTPQCGSAERSEESVESSSAKLIVKEWECPRSSPNRTGAP